MLQLVHRSSTFDGIEVQCEPDICFVTDVDGGTLFVSFDGEAWGYQASIGSNHNVFCLSAGWTATQILMIALSSLTRTGRR
jgi:hypothetical protein